MGESVCLCTTIVENEELKEKIEYLELRNSVLQYKNKELMQKNEKLVKWIASQDIDENLCRYVHDDCDNNEHDCCECILKNIDILYKEAKEE